MKLFAYSLRPYDELPVLQRLADERGFEFGWTSKYPTMDNAVLTQGYDAVTIITNPMPSELLARYAELGVRGLATRSIGFDHIDLDAARSLGIRVGHASYPPAGVADYTVMLTLMALRKAKLVDIASSYQDFGLRGKIGRSLNTCTVGVVGSVRCV